MLTSCFNFCRLRCVCLFVCSKVFLWVYLNASQVLWLRIEMCTIISLYFSKFDFMFEKFPCFQNKTVCTNRIVRIVVYESSSTNRKFLWEFDLFNIFGVRIVAYESYKVWEFVMFWFCCCTNRIVRIVHSLCVVLFCASTNRTRVRIVLFLTAGASFSVTAAVSPRFARPAIKSPLMTIDDLLSPLLLYKSL